MNHMSLERQEQPGVIHIHQMLLQLEQQVIRKCQLLELEHCKLGQEQQQLGHCKRELVQLEHCMLELGWQLELSKLEQLDFQQEHKLELQLVCLQELLHKGGQVLPGTSF